MLLSFLLLPLAEAACPASSAAFHDSLAAALGTWARGGEPALAEIQGDLACLWEPLPAEDARRLHLLHAVAAARAGDGGAALWAARGVLAVDPGYALPPDLAPEDGPLRAAFEAAAGSTNLAYVTVGEGAWTVDGEIGAAAIPLERSALVQSGGPGAIRSWYVAGPEVPADLARALLASIAERPVAADEDCTNGQDDDGDGLADCDDPGCARLCATPDLAAPAPRPRTAVHVVATAEGPLEVRPPLFWDGRGARDAGGGGLTWAQVEAIASLSPAGAEAVLAYRTGLAALERRDRGADAGIAVGVVLGSALAVGGLYNRLSGDFAELPSLSIVLGGVGLGLGSVLIGERVRAEPPAPGAVLQAAIANVEAAPVKAEPEAVPAP